MKLTLSLITLLPSLISGAAQSKLKRSLDLSTIFEDSVESWLSHGEQDVDDLAQDLTGSFLSAPSDMLSRSMVRATLGKNTKKRQSSVKYNHLQSKYYFHHHVDEAKLWELINEWIRHNRLGAIRLSQLPTRWPARISQRVAAFGIKVPLRTSHAIVLKRGKRTTVIDTTPIQADVQSKLDEEEMENEMSGEGEDSEDELDGAVDELDSAVDELDGAVDELARLQISSRSRGNLHRARRLPTVPRGLVKEDPTSRAWHRLRKNRSQHSHRRSNSSRPSMRSLDSELAEWRGIKADIRQEEVAARKRRLRDRIQQAKEEGDEEFLSQLELEKAARLEQQRQVALKAQDRKEARRQALQEEKRVQQAKDAEYVRSLQRKQIERKPSPYPYNPLTESDIYPGSLEQSLVLRQEAMEAAHRWQEEAVEIRHQEMEAARRRAAMQRALEDAREVEEQPGYLTNSMIYSQHKNH